MSKATFKNYSHYSLLESACTPKAMINTCKSNDGTICSIMDNNILSGGPEFYFLAKENDIKPIFGTNLSVTPQGHKVGLVALNPEGYVNLLHIIYQLQNRGGRHPYYSLHEIQAFCKTDGIVAIAPNNSECAFRDYSHKKVAEKVFGKIYEEMSTDNSYGYPVIWTNNSRFESVGDINKYKILKTIRDKCDFDCVTTNINLERPMEFVKRDSFEPVKNLWYLIDSVEDYVLERQPLLPKISDNADQLAILCATQLSRRNLDNDPVYTARLKHELQVLKDADLQDYFLIIKDILDHTRSLGYLTGPGRGSSAGCLVAYLLGITLVDPIKYNLIFERFYSAGRVGALPDIDFDIPKRARDQIIKYINKKYGSDKVCQIATYQTLMGREALKSVLRATTNISFNDMNEITKLIPDKAKIADELQEIKNEGGTDSVILWAVNNEFDMHKYCAPKYDDDFEPNGLTGHYADAFALAIELEGIKKSLSKHAAGIVISSEPLQKVCPMVADEKTNRLMSGPEMNELEKIGLIKYDCLGLSTLDRIEDAVKLIKEPV